MQLDFYKIMTIHQWIIDYCMFRNYFGISSRRTLILQGNPQRNVYLDWVRVGSLCQIDFMYSAWDPHIQHVYACKYSYITFHIMKSHTASYSISVHSGICTWKVYDFNALSQCIIVYCEQKSVSVTLKYWYNGLCVHEEQFWELAFKKNRPGKNGRSQMQVAVSFNQAGRIYCYLKENVINISLLGKKKWHWWCNIGSASSFVGYVRKCMLREKNISVSADDQAIWINSKVTVSNDLTMGLDC